MKEKTILILILVVLMIGVLFLGFYVWNDYKDKRQEAEQERQMCLEICSFMVAPYREKCNLECKEKLGKMYPSWWQKLIDTLGKKFLEIVD